MSMRDKIIKKYISVLDKIITDYESTKTEKRGRKNKFNNVFYLKRMMNIFLYNSFSRYKLWNLLHKLVKILRKKRRKISMKKL